MNRISRKNFFAVTFAMALTLLVVPGPATVSASDTLAPTTLSWVAGGVGGGWYVQAGGIARMITEIEPKIIIKVVPGGGVVNPVRVSSGKDDLGWGITFVDKMAYKGIAPLFQKPNPDVRALGGIFGTYYIHFVAARDAGIKTVEELAEKVKAGERVKVAMPMKGTSDLPLIETILGFYGISSDAIEKAGGKVFQAVYADMVSLYKDRHVDFVFTHLALPAAAVTEMFVSRASTLLKVSGACIDKLGEDLGTLSTASGQHIIPKGTYKGQENDTSTVVSTGELIVGSHVPDDVVYAITKILCEHIDKLHEVNNANRTFIPEKGGINVALPLHPGAEKFYREAGYIK
ncbi:MAG: TAXI family TRAP transporter solute-binding subunit [Desulfatiglandaceae bacterium]